jgi:uncharacterized membrane protein
MQALVEIIKNNFSNETALLLISMLPLIELKGSIPIGLVMGIGPFKTYMISFFGSFLPALPIIFWIMPIFDYLKKKKAFKKIVDRVTKRADKRKVNIVKYKYRGLFLFVAIPLPGTGVWMGSLISSLLDMQKSKSLLIIFFANALAGLLIYTFSNIFI